MPSEFDAIHWPAVIHYDNDAELEYIENASHWERESQWFQGNFEKDDVLIDVTGQLFALDTGSDGKVIPQRSSNSLSLEQVLGLVKAHLADQGSCCVAKMYAPGIREAFEMVRSGNECSI